MSAALPFLLFLLFFLGLWLAVHHLAPAARDLTTGVTTAIARTLLRWERFAPLRERLDRHAAAWKPWAPALVVALVGGSLAFAAGAAFLELAEQMREEDPAIARLDERVHRAAVDLRTRSGTGFFVLFTLIGTPVGLGIAVVAAAIACLATGRARWGWYLAVTAAGGGLLNLALKAFFARERPDLSEALRHADGFSFPSGHAMGSTVVFGSLMYLAMRAPGRWGVKSGAAALALSCIVAISASRIYLGVHWITDVAAGIAAGSLWVLATTAGYETFRRARSLLAQRSRARER